MEFDTFDAFDEGIEPGGLRSRSEIKILVCYLLKNIDKPVSKAQINEIMLENGLANYFEVNQAISDLVKNGSIEWNFENDEQFFYLTENGKAAAQMLESNLPRAVREKAINTAIRLMTRARREQENQIEVEKAENGGYHVTFRIFDMNDELLSLKIFVADSMQVETVRQNFLNDPVKLYSNIISSLTVE